MNSRRLHLLMCENRRWQDIVGLRTVDDLNAAIAAGHATEIINVTEAIQERKIAKVAAQIKELGTRLVLLAGPSSSGKTTTARRLMVQLGAEGLWPISISMDDYFLDRELTPRNARGEWDFECLEAVNVALFNEQLNALLSGERVELPRFDFVSGHNVPSGRTVAMGPNNVLIVEGIHALNPDLTPGIAPEEKFLLYVSALTTIQLDGVHRISTSDNRLLRRLIRDSNYRGCPAETTLHRWASVRAGEERWIFPFQDHADMMVNSALFYEFAVLRPHVEPLLQAVDAASPAYGEACRLLELLAFFSPIPDDQIPLTSLLREFLGGSTFTY
ncbi:MAG: nucleoside kinase [Bacteroidaceae bacterium]|nr:nucleoside kinase [Bacteroidaceae bacterium]